MDKVANLTPDQRRELFEVAGGRRRVNPAIMEKDFWVCWVLRRLFSDADLKDHLIFKGGTSLSKVYGLIDRFSEDIDLVLDWTLLGYGQGLIDPYQNFDSKGKQDRFNKEINAKATVYIEKNLLPKFNELFADVPGLRVSIDPSDPYSVNVAYPAIFKEAYIRPAVRLEIGPLASWVPSKQYAIQPYAAAEIPSVFENPSCPVVVIAAERTFWEKAAILHKEAHRPGIIPLRHSRHYYDVYKLTTSAFGKTALTDSALRQEVVAFKQRFYPSSWARYDLAKPGTFKMIPSADHFAVLKKDYQDMAVMIFGEIPVFERIIETLRALEDQINRQP
jgi:hypothetical protein